MWHLGTFTIIICVVICVIGSWILIKYGKESMFK